MKFLCSGFFAVWAGVSVGAGGLLLRVCRNRTCLWGHALYCTMETTVGMVNIGSY